MLIKCTVQFCSSILSTTERTVGQPMRSPWAKITTKKRKLAESSDDDVPLRVPPAPDSVPKCSVKKATLSSCDSASQGTNSLKIF